jgi:methyl-accepting chemotaxis protein
MSAKEITQDLLNILKINSDDIAVLNKNRDVFRRILPNILTRVNSEFTSFPDLQAALRKSDVHEPRQSHWLRLVCGDLGVGFRASAEKLARAFYDNHVPAQAVAICHGVVLQALILELGFTTAAKTGLFTNKAADQEKQKLRAALNKMAWLDIEVLLECYHEVEQAARARTLDNLRDFESKMQMIVGVVGDSVQQMKARAESLTRSVDETTRRTASMAEASSEATQNVETAAQAADKLSGSIGSVASQVTKAATIAATANQTVRQTDTTVQGLASAAQKIGEVVSLINNIAGQTNLLALNATIEAARAGDAGKGFAVVASEVKNLAAQTARATEEISSQIGAMQATTNETVEAIRGIGAIVADIDQIAAAIAWAVEEQRTATHEIAGNVQRAARGTQNVSSNISGVRDVAGASNAAAQDVLSLSGDLGEQAADLQQAFADLLKRVRAN